MPSGHIDPATPLKPLSDHAWGELRRIVARPTGVARHTVNPGVANRLFREALIEQVGQTYVATAAGVAKVRGRS